MEPYITNTAEGQGILLYNSGAIYEGYFKNSVKYGEGRMIGYTGVVYTGQWI